jgi:hypothetical protein
MPRRQAVAKKKVKKSPRNIQDPPDIIKDLPAAIDDFNSAAERAYEQSSRVLRILANAGFNEDDMREVAPNVVHFMIERLPDDFMEQVRTHLAQKVMPRKPQ